MLRNGLNTMNIPFHFFKIILVTYIPKLHISRSREQYELLRLTVTFILVRSQCRLKYQTGKAPLFYKKIKGLFSCDPWLVKIFFSIRNTLAAFSQVISLSLQNDGC